MSSSNVWHVDNGVFFDFGKISHLYLKQQAYNKVPYVLHLMCIFVNILSSSALSHHALFRSIRFALVNFLHSTISFSPTSIAQVKVEIISNQSMSKRDSIKFDFHFDSNPTHRMEVISENPFPRQCLIEYKAAYTNMCMHLK